MINVFTFISRSSRFCLTTFFLISVFYLAGCSSGSVADPAGSRSSQNGSSGPKPDSGSTKKDEPAERAGGICENPFYPVNTEVSREFKISGSAPASYVLSQSLRDTDSFTEKRKFASGLEVVSNWSCSEDGIRNADYNNTISGMKMKMNMETIESSGITLPKIWKTGEKWSSDYKVRVNVASQTANGTITVKSEIVSMDDNVQVQAGDFVAARVDSVLTTNISLGKTRIPSPEFKMTNWYAPKVGLVKQETKGGFGTTKLEYIGEK
ncbi:MAG: hypothetical protein KDB79_04310 [Acidobacteria bacterium]|nr:hypothetical protein [Acidobacteriota bacterium]